MPCLLLHDGALVKTIKFKSPNYIGDPINAVKIFNDLEVDELIVLDILATKQNQEPDYKLISELASQCFMPLTYGGGIQTIEQMKKLFGLGVEKVSLNSQALREPSLISRAAEKFGNQSIVASMDVKKDWMGKYKVFSSAGVKPPEADPVAYARLVEERGAGEILLNSVDQDGTMLGYDIELIHRVARAVKIPVVACGGAGEVSHFTKAVKVGGASAVAAGSLVVYQGKNKGVLINFPSREELRAAL
jgi:cyclase